uniref:Ground-like domain-containing protein n=1 Tax=Meloidogyne enterolobii TaxID=390850 RepID=A0A6V7YAG5_MELEN|nr:unnamed protein product [Meloidogyne enterolobii]
MAILRCLKLDSCTILLIITNILLQITPASTETAILKAHYPLTLPSASFVDPSILRRKRLEANAAAVRQQLQHQRDVQVENVGGLLGPLPSINTGNDATGRQPPNNVQNVLGEQQTQQQSIVAPIHSSIPSAFSQHQQAQEAYPPSSTPPANYQVEQQQSTEIYARLGQQQQHATLSATEEDYQSIATPVAPLSPDNAATPSGYENNETPPPPQLSNFAHRTKRIKRTAPQPRQSQALLRCLREAAIVDSLAQRTKGPVPPVRVKARSPSHRVNVDIAPRRIDNNEKNHQSRVHGHRIQQADHEYSSAPLHQPSIHPTQQFHGGGPPHLRPGGHSQFFVPASTQGGADYVHHQQQQQQQYVQVPHAATKVFGGEGEHGGGAGGGEAPQGVGVLSGSTRGSNLPTMISLGQKGHKPFVSSVPLPPGTNAHRYYYPPRIPLPLPTCFHNPTGYPCCNPKLNDLIVETYTMLESKPRFHTCNINAIAQHLQIRAETRFNMSFETVAAFDDFAQKIHFAGDLVCKVELGGKYMLAYATVKDVSRVLSVEPSEQQNEDGAEGSAASNNISGKRRKRQVYGPELPKPLNDLTRHYSMWI